MKTYILSIDGSVTEGDIPHAELSCALGCFDGVHAGHKVLMDTAIRNFFGYAPAVWTFSEPLSIPYIESVEDRLAECGRLGIKYAVCEDFVSVRKMTPDEFISHLHNDLGVRHFICGRDFRFGTERSGDVEALRNITAKLGDIISIVPPRTVESVIYPEIRESTKIGTFGPTEQADGEKISSSLIREMIAMGEIETATCLLGRRFAINAVVCAGKHIGRTIGMPTINQRLSPGRVVPAFGVYYSVAMIDGIVYPAVTNIGSRPTVNSNKEDVTCETHILDYNADLYGKCVKVELCKFARKEQKFDDVEVLKAAISGDIDGARSFFGVN